METQISETEIKTNYNSELFCDQRPDKIIKNVFGRRNLCDLERIRRVILVEENKPLELKKVFARVLEHYNKSVNYR
jgi:hypothetical protein